ncbi:helix-turn-helix domain-containing protein [Nocardia goodfellowii]|uniref:Transcriptional regulator with XRE-family HTH domain n=1 Tax=Nocardia goodfellowii TaxID=882446 RepID=A0ABS4QV70_9NOCA|nr:helix-turn-helix transcriptional regulator [Nocardia goodfellowii]MBP2194531.1 transcriptional regulator with XRE-family HTH domain [Nocardia goodfellowii]
MTKSAQDLTRRATEPDGEWQRFGARLRALRHQARKSQDDIAAALTIPRSAVSELERGNRKLYSSELARLARFYGVSADEILDLPVETSALLGVDLHPADYRTVLTYAEYLRYRHACEQR